MNRVSSYILPGLVMLGMAIIPVSLIGALDAPKGERMKDFIETSKGLVVLYGILTIIGVGLGLLS